MFVIRGNDRFRSPSRVLKFRSTLEGTEDQIIGHRGLLRKGSNFLRAIAWFCGHFLRFPWTISVCPDSNGHELAQASLTAREPIAHAACKVVQALEIFGSRSPDTFMPPTTSDDDIAEHLPHGVGESWEPAVRRSSALPPCFLADYLYNVSPRPRVTSTSLYIRWLHYCILIDTGR